MRVSFFDESRFTTRNRLTRNDAPLSVLRHRKIPPTRTKVESSGLTQITLSYQPWLAEPMKKLVPVCTRVKFCPPLVLR